MNKTIRTILAGGAFVAAVMSFTIGWETIEIRQEQARAVRGWGVGCVAAWVVCVGEPVPRRLGIDVYAVQRSPYAQVDACRRDYNLTEAVCLLDD